jgi:hypothetical protein
MSEKTGSGQRPQTTRRRKHGYRGYGSGFGRGSEGYGGGVHWGQGFGGVGVAGLSAGNVLPHAGVVPERIHTTYIGLGPRGNVRSDERIREEICDELTRRPDMDPRWIEVRVEDGEVTLEGTVEDRITRAAIDEVATNCAGVRQVFNRLRVEETPRAERRTSGKNGNGRKTPPAS